MTRLGDHAIEYDLRGWVIIPMVPGTKRAFVKWKRIDEPDEMRTREWWTRFPEASIGVLCGPTGLVVIDVDDAEYLDRLPPLPATATVTTGRGVHHIYKDGTAGRLRNTAGRIPVRGAWVDTPGIDLRASGGLFVAPPSIHKSGTRYTWNPDDFAIGVQPAPEWLQPHEPKPVNRPTPRFDGDASKQVAGILRVVATATQGQRNHCLNWAAYAMASVVADGRISHAEAHARLSDAGAATGLDASEVAATVDSGLSAGGTNT